ncbi:hypothetical protein GCM10025858_24290 [Alicyclobacillus sacchari]|nr:hypothetical protein GCM10025858_24290 [Alicyclobacillus sacchari]
MSSQEADLHARSPWALHGVHLAAITPATQPIVADVIVPGSKSVTNRALVIAALAEGVSRLSGVLRSDDAYWCIEALRQLGVRVEVRPEAVVVEGTGGSWPNANTEVYTGAGGTAARFLTSALAAGHGSWVIRGSRRMNERPMGELFQALTALGAVITPMSERPHTLPIRLEANGLTGGTVHMSGATSSQFISGMLIAAPYAQSPLTVEIVDHIVQHAYVHITLDMMRDFGARVKELSGLSAMQVEASPYIGREYEIEADASTACYFWAAAALTRAGPCPEPAV